MKPEEERPVEREAPLTAERSEGVRARIEELERELEGLRRQAGLSPAVRRPSRGTLGAGAVLLAAVLAAIFLSGYLPRRQQESRIVAEARARTAAAPSVRVTLAQRAPRLAELRLPGTIQAITEAPILARADGYVQRRYVDIGDRVSAGQLLAELKAPELDEQARQAKATLEQARAAREQARANYEQELSRAELARVTAARWANLLQRGVVSRQENDQQQADYKAHQASVEALAKAIAAAESNVAAAEANAARTEEMRGYLKVRALFAGVVTLRNVDVGTLVTAGNTLLFRIAQINLLRTYISVPQTYAGFVRPGTPALLTLADRPGQPHTGTVTRAASALDPATRTMLVEVQVPNPTEALLPGMYAQMTLDVSRKEAPLLLDADALQVRSDGTFVAVVGPDQRVRLRKVTLGRDYGPQVEVLGGLAEGERVVINPNDEIQQGVHVNVERSDSEQRPAPAPGAAPGREAH
jgi:RND family efflux transporter MFP subunit